MQMTRTVEIWVGAFVALGLVALFFVAMQVSNLGEFRTAKGSYVVKAHFGNIGGLRVRAPVSMAGVTVGRVERIAFDDKRYEALVEMRIDPAYKSMPEDTSASILTAGLLGEQYVGLSAGGSEDYLKDGDEIELTQSAVVLEQLISRLLFNKAEEGKGDKKSAAEETPVAEAKSSPAVKADEAPPARLESRTAPARQAKPEPQPQRAAVRKAKPVAKAETSVKANKPAKADKADAKAKDGKDLKAGTKFRP